MFISATADRSAAKTICKLLQKFYLLTPLDCAKNALAENMAEVSALSTPVDHECTRKHNEDTSILYFNINKQIST